MENNLKEKILLQVESFQKALKRLNEALGFEEKQIPGRLNIDAAIQRFEFCYELAWKLMQSVIRYKGKDCQSPRDCFRTAVQVSLINNPSSWIEYLDARNLTTHTYSEDTADIVYQTAKQFAHDAAAFLDSVKQTLKTEL